MAFLGPHLFLQLGCFGLDTYLDKQNAESLHQAAVLAKDNSLTHKVAFSRDVQNSAGHNGGTASPKLSNDTRKGSKSSKFNVPVCFYCECWKQESDQIP